MHKLVLQCCFLCCRLREIRHDNINSFIGASVEPLRILIITDYCSKGSLYVSLDSRSSMRRVFFQNCQQFSQENDSQRYDSRPGSNQNQKIVHQRKILVLVFSFDKLYFYPLHNILFTKYFGIDYKCRCLMSLSPVRPIRILTFVVISLSMKQGFENSFFPPFSSLYFRL